MNLFGMFTNGGTLSGGALQQSTSILPRSLLVLIIAQREYEANARCIATFDQVAQDTINLKH